MVMPQKYFCNAKRVFCLKETNICCLICDLHEECKNASKVFAHKSIKIKPCEITDFEENEICEFLT